MDNFCISGHYHAVEIFDTAAKMWDFEFIQLDRGDFFADLVQFGDHQMIIGTCHWNRHLQQRGTAPANYYTFAIHGPKSVPHNWRFIPCPLNSIIVFPENRELSSTSPPGYETITVSIEERYLLSLTQSLGYPEPHAFIKRGEVAIVELDQIERLKIYLYDLCWIAKKSSHPAFGSLLSEKVKWSITKMIFAALSSGTELKMGKASVKTSRVISRVLDYIGSDQGKDVSIPALCRVAEVSERTLRNIFRKTFPVGPKKYQQYRRLNLVRRELQRSESGPLLIADIANSNGFWHMGQFAADYQRLFGELPSETLQR